MSKSFLKVNVLKNSEEIEIIDDFEYRNKPFLNSEICHSNIDSFKLLTRDNNLKTLKTVYQLNLSLKGINYEFLPGDSIAVLPENDEKEVNELLNRLNIEQTCDKQLKLEISEKTTKKNAAIPKHLPPICTLRNIFKKFVDIRSVPKKLFLKSLIEYTSDPTEKELLQILCSPKGSNEYIGIINNCRTLLSLLNHFPSCMPPIELILEYSSPLNPRYYSISSSPTNKTHLSIIFFVMLHQDNLKGVCTGWLETLLPNYEKHKVAFYFRKPGEFRLRVTQEPHILVATGTGIAPFLGFLEQSLVLNQTMANMGSNILFYGCRYSDKDFLFQDKLIDYVKDGILLNIYNAFSRKNESKTYVQHKILEVGEIVADMILNKNATVAVCGDFKTVVKDVRSAILQCIKNYIGDTETAAAEDILNQLVKNKKYLVDSWV